MSNDTRNLQKVAGLLIQIVRKIMTKKDVAPGIVPEELKACDQWIVSQPDCKVPRQLNGDPAAVNNCLLYTSPSPRD